jgi:hypothetical protein
MKTFIKSTVFLFGLINCCFAASKLDVSQLRSVPDGNYLVTLELNGKPERMNVQIQGDKAKCVNSSDADLKNAEGNFQALQQQRGVFAITFRTPKGNMTQIWIFRPDGAAAIRENPDRGEHQIAIPVSGTSLESPQKK